MMKNVPVRDVPPLEIAHAEAANRPEGDADIEHEVSPLLNCPKNMLTCTVVPGAEEGGGAKASSGKASTVKLTLPKSPELPVTVIVGAPTAAPNPTVNDAVTMPSLTLQLGEARRLRSVAVIWQLISWSLNPFP